MTDEEKKQDDTQAANDQQQLPPTKEGLLIWIMKKENKEVLNLMLKGGVYLSLLLILYMLGGIYTHSLIEWAKEVCPNPDMEWAASPWELTYRNTHNSTTATIIGVMGDGGTG